jgi:tetratricopeptide (TPR) repeat protein
MIQKKFKIIIMHKTIALVLGLALSMSVFAQKADVISAVLSFQKNDVVKAKEFIDRVEPGADLGEKTLSKYWYYRGNIYYSIAVSKDEAIIALDANAVDIALESFKTELEIDVKERFSKKEIKEKIWSCAIIHLNSAFAIIDANAPLSTISKTDAAITLKHLESAIAIKAEPIIGKTDSSSIYTASIIAQYAGVNDKATALAQQVIDLGYKAEFGFFNLINIYKSLGNTDKALEVIQAAKLKYPSSESILVEEVNIYIGKGEADKAIEPLKAAVQANPNNGLFHATLGGLFVSVGQMSNAENSFKKAVELDSSIAGSWFGLGNISIEKANALVEKMNAKNVSQSKYEAYKKEQLNYFKQARPNYEHVLELEPENLDAMAALKIVYYKLDMSKEMLAIKNRMDELTK